jgi:hypothetical protein
MTRNAVPALVLCLCAAGGLFGCTRLEIVPRAQMDPGRIYPRSLVFLDDGTRYDFRRVSVRADSLVGEYRVTVERESSEAGVVYADEVRAFPIPLARVDSLGVVRRDPVKTFFYGAGLAAVGYAVFEMIDSDQLGRRASHGKPGQGGPD